MLQEKTHRLVLSARSIAMGVLCCLVATVLLAQDKPAPSSSGTSAATQPEGKTTYESVCAACHGLDARGGERGPDIASRPEIVRKSDAQLTEILANGKPTKGMPSFSSFGPVELSAVVAYLRTLQGRGGSAMPGDPEKGEGLFKGKAKCSECHSIGGLGGFFAPDLTSYATRLDAKGIRTKILNPDKSLDPRRGLVRVVLSDATELTGIARNEDNFSIQLQTQDGVFHLLNKSDIRSQSYTGQSGMPNNYGATLTAGELDDIISYLLRSSATENTEPHSDQPEN